MCRRTALVALVASLAAAGTGHAQEPRDFSLLATQIVQLPGTTYSIVFNSPELQVGEPRNMQVLSEAIGSWLSVNFGLPMMQHPPRIAYAPAADFVPFRARSSSGSVRAAEIPSFYDGHSQTVFLPQEWNGSTPIELSVFVREMARHLQNEANNAYHCTPSNDDKFALAVQRRWLAMFGDGTQEVSATHDLAFNPHCASWQSTTSD